MISFAYQEEGPLWMGLRVICHTGPVHMSDGSEVGPRRINEPQVRGRPAIIDTRAVIEGFIAGTKALTA